MKYILFMVLLSNQCSGSQGLPDNEDQKAFSFFINSDSQMGSQTTNNPGLRILNDLLRDFTLETNAIPDHLKPDFVVFNGDLVTKPIPENFSNFKRLTENLIPTTVLVHGNHDGIYPDTQFLDLQEDLSGYRARHYSFDYGNWHFVVMAAPEQYPTTQSRDELINWLDNDLSSNTDKQTMLFMHYHIMPVGLSQMEFYTYTPIEFKNELLNTITSNDVDYVVSGHVHAGIKGSVKTMLEYKNTRFIIAPTSVLGRMFGEEYPNMEGSGSTRHLGYYLEVKIDHDDIELIGHKTGSNETIIYPDIFKPVKPSDQIRSFVKEGDLKPGLIYKNDFSLRKARKQLLNGSFDNGLNNWGSSYRYVSDDEQSFVNYVDDGTNILQINSKWGGWNREEHLENYQIFDYKPNMTLSVKFLYPSQLLSAGAYIKLVGYDLDNKLVNFVLFHWGEDEDTIKYIPQSWGYQWLGKRASAFIVNTMITSNEAISFTLPVINNVPQKLHVSIDKVISQLSNHETIDHFSLSYGIWTRYNSAGAPYKAEIRVDSIEVLKSGLSSIHPIIFNGQIIDLSAQEESMDYGAPYLQ